VLEWIQKKPLAQCLREDLVQPLHLGNMTYLPDKSLPIVPSCYGNPIEEKMCRERNLSFSFFRPADRPVRGEVNDGNAHYYFGGVSGHAGIFADAAAWERLCRFCMNSKDPLLLEAQKEQPGADGRGLGFQTGMSYPHGCGHTGFTGTGIYFSAKYKRGRGFPHQPAVLSAGEPQRHLGIPPGPARSRLRFGGRIRGKLTFWVDGKKEKGYNE
jgi:CubicO group peptidase (beta-lactamase class C family)